MTLALTFISREQISSVYQKTRASSMKMHRIMFMQHTEHDKHDTQ